MFLQELEIALHKAFIDARARRHDYTGAEHLLLALLDTPSTGAMLRAGKVDVEGLRQALTGFVERIEPGRSDDPQPNAAFQRIIQRAIVTGQSSRRREIDAATVVEAIIADGKTHAARLLSDSAAPLKRTEPDVQVVIYNDDATPMQYVVDLLEAFFDMSHEEAKETMLEIHRDGAAVCGLYSRTSGEEIVAQVSAHARAHGHPLRCVAVTPK